MTTSFHYETLGGRLAVDFANFGRVFSGGTPRPLTWAALITFLEAAKVVSTERSVRLLSLPQTGAESAEGLLAVAGRLQNALRSGFAAMAARGRMERGSARGIDGIFRVAGRRDGLEVGGGTVGIEVV